MIKRIIYSALAFAVALGLAATPAFAQGHAVARGGGGHVSGGPGGGAGGPGTAVPRTGYPGGAYPGHPIYGYGGYYHPYYYYPGWSFGLGFYYGYPYAFYPGFGFSVGYGYGYPYYGYPYPYYAPAYPPPAGYVAASPGAGYGGVRIMDAPKDAEVYADGYFVGRVDDFDGSYQRLTLEAGAHKIEIRAPGFESLSFDVQIVPGQTVSYRAKMRPPS